MNTYNVVISVTTTVCIDAKSADNAIEKYCSMKKELYEVTRVRGDEKKELGSYLLKPGPEAAMDFFHNILKRDDKLEVSIKSTETGFSLTDNSEPDVNYIMTQVPMDDSFWETCTASKNR